MTARVLSRRFLGESDLLHVAVDGLPRPLHVRLAPEIPAGAVYVGVPARPLAPPAGSEGSAR